MCIRRERNGNENSEILYALVQKLSSRCYFSVTFLTQNKNGLFARYFNKIRQLVSFWEPQCTSFFVSQSHGCRKGFCYVTACCYGIGSRLTRGLAVRIDFCETLQSTWAKNLVQKPWKFSILLLYMFRTYSRNFMKIESHSFFQKINFRVIANIRKSKTHSKKQNYILIHYTFAYHVLLALLT